MADIKIGLASWKGGCGKTTIAWNLAERAAAGGLPVTVFDLDETQAAYTVSLWRTAPGWQVESGEVTMQGASALEDRFWDIDGVAICDFPGAEDAAAVRLLRMMDLVVCPTRLTALDLAVAGDFARVAKESGISACIVANQMPPSRRHRAAWLETGLGAVGLEVAPAELAHRVAYSHALAAGQGVCEFEPNGKAAAEVDALWQWVAGRLRSHGGIC